MSTEKEYVVAPEGSSFVCLNNVALDDIFGWDVPLLWLRKSVICGMGKCHMREGKLRLETEIKPIKALIMNLEENPCCEKVLDWVMVPPDTTSFCGALVAPTIAGKIVKIEVSRPTDAVAQKDQPDWKDVAFKAMALNEIACMTIFNRHEGVGAITWSVRFVLMDGSVCLCTLAEIKDAHQYAVGLDFVNEILEMDCRINTTGILKELKVITL